MTLDDNAIADLQDDTNGVLWFDDDDDNRAAPSYTIQLRYKIDGDRTNTRVLYVQVVADGRLMLHGIGGGKTGPINSEIQNENATGLNILHAIDWLWGIER